MAALPHDREHLGRILARARINTRKRTRYLYWQAGQHYVQRPMGQADAGDTVEVKLSDSLEPDRLAILTLPDDEAVRLAARIAHLVGYRLIKMEPGR